MFEMARDELLLNQSHRKWYPVGGIISPVSDAYKKPHLAPAKHRIEICKLAVKESDWVIVDDWEAMQEDHLPTAQVLKPFKNDCMSVMVSVEPSSLLVLILCAHLSFLDFGFPKTLNTF